MGNARKMKIAAFMAVVMLAGSVPVISGATSTQDQLDAAQHERDELEQQHQETTDKLDGLKEEQKTLTGELNALNRQLTEISEHLEELEGQIRDKQQEIEEIRAALEAAREKEAWQYECMKVHIQMMYEQGDSMYLEALLSVGSLADFLNFNEYFEQLTLYNQKLFEEYAANREYIEGEESRLLQEMAQLEQLELDAEAEKSKVSGLIGQTSRVIAKYSDQIEDAEAQARAYEAEIKEKEKDIEYLKKKIAEEKALSQAAANAAWRDISEVTFAESDKWLLANIIYCEAGGEPYAGKLAVGAVVINRVLSSRYPDTVEGVIYQKSQFSPVASGRLGLALGSNKANADCYRAAEEAMSGMTNVGNCLYFRTPVPGLTGINIGGHVFY